ncbi:unnamed protein product [Rotaria sordida]|uniref:Uncharacterized protein n=1 Tax=Rotaria sordida TaxID=392033 RepID=A0A814HBF2_9BILA|nr:unnamed protein product [Rotaria sordida]
MQQPLLYPFYMGTSRLPVSIPWSSGSFHVSPSRHKRYLFPSQISQQFSPFIQSQQQQNPYPTIVPASPSCSNRRYQHLKKLTTYHNRHPSHRSVNISKKSYHNYGYNEPIYTHPYQPSKTKSVSDLKHMPQFTSIQMPKAHSWHTMMNNHRQTNLSVAYAEEMDLTPKHRRKRSTKKHKRKHSQRHLSLSPKRNSSFLQQQKRSIQMPECGIVRISTLDEMPINNNNNNNDNNNQTNKRNNSINNDRLSMTGSLLNLSKRRKISKENNSIKNRKININEETRIDLDTESSSSSSSSSYSSLQQRLNGSLRNDPLISAAMEDFQQLRRSSSQNTSMISYNQNLSRDNSLSSNSTLHSSTISHNNSQSSFTSIERSEIRGLIKTIKTQSTTSIPISVPSSEQSIISNIQQLTTRKTKPKKSCVTEELDRKFNKLRALDPDQELTCVIPSSICKRKKTLEKSFENIPSVPKLDELLRQVQLRPVNKLMRPKSPLKEKSRDDNYENPLSCIPVPQSSPIPTPEIKIEEIKHDYAVPIKKTEEKLPPPLPPPPPSLCHFQPIRKFNLNKPKIFNNIPEKRSKFNWLQYGLTNQMPTTFQPNLIVNNHNEHGTNNVKENIYTSDIDIYIPSSTTDKNDDNTLQTHLDNQTIVTDDYYSDFGTKQITISSSLIDDFSNLFTRKHKQEVKLHKKTQRCSIM